MSEKTLGDIQSALTPCVEAVKQLRQGANLAETRDRFVAAVDAALSVIEAGRANWRDITGRQLDTWIAEVTAAFDRVATSPPQKRWTLRPADEVLARQIGILATRCHADEEVEHV